MIETKNTQSRAVEPNSANKEIEAKTDWREKFLSASKEAEPTQLAGWADAMNAVTSGANAVTGGINRGAQAIGNGINNGIQAAKDKAAEKAAAAPGADTVGEGAKAVNDGARAVNETAQSATRAQGAVTGAANAVKPGNLAGQVTNSARSAGTNAVGTATSPATDTANSVNEAKRSLQGLGSFRR